MNAITPSSELEHYLTLIAPDRALVENFRASNPNLVRLFIDLFGKPEADDTPKPFPPIGEMTAIQAAIFDNWPDGKRTKNHPNRYGMAIEVWTAPSDTINVTKRGSYQHKGNVRLMDAKELGKRIEGLRSPKLRNPISAAYATALTDVRMGMEQGHYVGLIATKTPEEGTFYHDLQFVYVVVDGEETRCILIVGEDKFLLPTFSAKQPNGEPLNGANVILQSRCDRGGFSTTWATPEWNADQ